VTATLVEDSHTPFCVSERHEVLTQQLDMHRVATGLREL
jgi:hypothetical protein